MTNTDVEQVIKKYPWGTLYTSTGDACDIPERLRGLIASTTEVEAEHWYFLLENYIVVQGGVYESALPCIDVLLTAIKHCKLSNMAIVFIYELFYQIIHGVTDIDSIRRGNPFEAERCKTQVLQHLEALRSKCVPEAAELLRLIINETE